MKLKNKKTGEIGIINYFDNQSIVIYPIDENWNAKGDKKYVYHSLAELNKEWGDVPEEPKEYWYIDPMVCGVYYTKIKEDEDLYNFNKQIGNYFETKEEAEKVVEKLKAFTKLCKKGFEFNSVEMFGSGLIRIESSIPINEKTTLQERSNITDSLYLLFGGEK